MYLEAQKEEMDTFSSHFVNIELQILFENTKFLMQDLISNVSVDSIKKVQIQLGIWGPPKNVPIVPMYVPLLCSAMYQPMRHLNSLSNKYIRYMASDSI